MVADIYHIERNTANVSPSGFVQETDSYPLIVQYSLIFQNLALSWITDFEETEHICSTEIFLVYGVVKS